MVIVTGIQSPNNAKNISLTFDVRRIAIPIKITRPNQIRLAYNRAPTLIRIPASKKLIDTPLLLYEAMILLKAIMRSKAAGRTGLSV